VPESKSFSSSGDNLNPRSPLIKKRPRGSSMPSEMEDPIAEEAALT